MRKSIFYLNIFFILTLLVLSGCQSSSETVNEDQLQVVTTTAQIADPLRIIGGDRIHVESLMGPGVDPHLYEASQSDISRLEQADILFYNGVHLEANMSEVFEHTSVPTFAFSSAANPSDLLEDPDRPGSPDPHIWFDIDIWEKGIDAAVDQLKEISPEDAAFFEENKQDYLLQLEQLKAYALEKLGSIDEDQRVLVTAHDAFQYFARMTNLEVVALQGLSTESEIGISDVQSTVQTIVEKEIPSVFVESSVNQSAIQSVIEGVKRQGHQINLGGELYSDAMGERGTEAGTYIGMYRYNVDTIYEALSGGTES
ncbi:metal ABC transporter solute-binding protein, Zn/Mn family [Alkalicoccobacillus murimartini]|uniref:Manganese/zinc/iron transport system substrate-binding protein n=1 Tax=Alkalicoccobacillus murimartini TaxID=171685 RepID=A0ABT9YH07_9BACI|nr:zinc ABC transporter substrate-binding protein [Alkalicoccobacillus murimartini]MDQ0207145.1 manganese/zinc/iron transport system substrate-binding protein [Alkalicoccobacillus murimartini]